MRKYLPILRIPSIVLLFLPYTSGESPWTTVSGKEWAWPFALLGGPFFLSIPILVAQVRVLLKRPFSKGERATYRLLAGAALAAGLAFLGDGIRTQGFSKENIPPIASWSIPCAAAVGLMILSARKLPPEAATTLALRAAWVPNVILCEFGFLSNWQIGASLAAFTIVLYTVGIAVSMGTNRCVGISS
jgi:hypothetical protein